MKKKKSTLNTAACVPSEGSDAFAINLKSMMVLMEVWGSIYDVSWYNYTTAFVATISNNCRGAVRRRPISEKSHLDHNLVIITERYSSVTIKFSLQGFGGTVTNALREKII